MLLNFTNDTSKTINKSQIYDLYVDSVYIGQIENTDNVKFESVIKCTSNKIYIGD